MNRLELITTFLRKSLFEQQPAIAKEQLIAVPIAEFGSLWSSLVAPVASLFTFDYVVSNFGLLIESLFGFLTPAVPTGFRTAPAATGGGFGFASRPSFGRGYFAPDARNTIINAGRSGTMVQFDYQGFRRLIEPYKLEYYVRKKDNRGFEYFWGWDTSGGKSGKIGIKQFFCDQIQAVRPTTQTFSPRYPIEL